MTISIFNKTNYKKSKLEKLKNFCTVVENQDSILKASQYLFISSSAISKHISSLEQDLGYKLFDRKGKRLALNKKGEEYYKIAKNLLLDIKKLYSPTLENIDKNEIKRVLGNYIHLWTKSV
jgi:DNA-binding transcriptional LysR family regulator